MNSAAKAVAVIANVQIAAAMIARIFLVMFFTSLRRFLYSVCSLSLL